MNQLPSERIKELHKRMMSRERDDNDSVKLMITCILVYLDEEYENRQEEISNLKDHIRNLEHDVWPEGWDFIE